MKKKNKRWTAAYASKILERADRARSDNAYAEARGINGQRLSWWRKRLGRPRRAAVPGASSGQASFVEVTAKRPAPAVTVEVLLANGRQVRVSEHVEPEVLARIADALEGRC